jgi:hypothetical protein
MKTIAAFLLTGLLAGNAWAQTGTTRQSFRRWAIAPHVFTGISYCIADDLPAYTHVDAAATFRAGIYIPDPKRSWLCHALQRIVFLYVPYISAARFVGNNHISDSNKEQAPDL